jgi:glycosyltransferase involved in cell wall biosynthesis
MKILLSIVIPTRNRINTAYCCAKQTLAVTNSADIEVIVHDCSDIEALGPKLEDLCDTRLRYFHIDPVSMTENWNTAIQKVRGEYVIFIGDDDGVLPDIYELCKWAQRNNIPALGHEISALYLWPDYPDKKLSSTLYIYPCDGKLKYYNGKKEFTKCISSGYCNNFHRLPHLYHGIIKMEYLNEIKKKSGCFFDGTCPDYYSAFSLSLTLKEYCVVSFPFTYNGGCGESNAGRGITNINAKHLQEYQNFKWPSELPDNAKYMNVYIAESLYRVLNNFGMLNLLKTYNFSELYASCIVSKQFYKDIRGLLTRYFKLKYHSFSVYFILLFYYIVKDVFHKTIIKIKIMRKKDPVFLVPKKHKEYPAKDIFEANQILSEYIKKRGIFIRYSRNNKR